MSNRHTYSLSSWNWLDFLKGPPGRIHVISVALYLLIYTLGSSSPGGFASSGTWIGQRASFFGLLVLLGGLPLMLVACLDYFVRIWLAGWFKLKSHPSKRITPRRGNLRWLVTPVCICLVLSVWSSHWPLKLRFGMSRQAFEAVRLNAASGQIPSSPLLLGSFSVTSVTVYRPGLIFFETGRSGFDAAGLVYSANDQPRRAGQTRVAPCWFEDVG